VGTLDLTSLLQNPPQKTIKNTTRKRRKRKRVESMRTIKNKVISFLYLCITFPDHKIESLHNFNLPLTSAEYNLSEAEIQEQAYDPKIVNNEIDVIKSIYGV